MKTNETRGRIAVRNRGHHGRSGVRIIGFRQVREITHHVEDFVPGIKMYIARGVATVAGREVVVERNGNAPWWTVKGGAR